LEPALEIVTINDRNAKGASDFEVLGLASSEGLIVVSHDLRTMRPLAEELVRTGRAIPGLLLTSQRSRSRDVAESLVLIWAASEAEEWINRIEFIPF
jgi:hypothetical protein